MTDALLQDLYRYIGDGNQRLLNRLRIYGLRLDTNIFIAFAIYLWPLMLSLGYSGRFYCAVVCSIPVYRYRLARRLGQD